MPLKFGVSPGETLSPELLLAEVQGLSGRCRLGDLVHGPTLIVFLRHFG